MRKSTLLLVLATALGGCEPNYPDAGCAEPQGALNSAIIAGPTSAPLTADLPVRGTLDHADDVTVFKVFVAGVPATNDGYDYDSFSVTVPLATLQSLSFAQSTPGKAKIDVTAVTNCDVSTPVQLTSFEVPLLVASKTLQTLAFAPVVLPHDYVPTTKQVPAQIRLIANPEAVGATVKLTTSLGTLDGSVTLNVTLAGDGINDAGAVVYLNPDPNKEGDAAITAQTLTLIASTTVHTAGPPQLLPSNAGLSAGKTTRISVFTLGQLQGCKATPATGLTISSGDQDLTVDTTVPTDQDGDGHPDIDISAAAGTPVQTATTVSCFDVYNQTSMVTYQVK